MKIFKFSLLLILLLPDIAAARQTADIKELEKQIEQGLDVNTRDENGDTLLYWVLANDGNLRAIKMLVDSGADVNAPSAATGMTPLVYVTTMADRIRSAALEEFNSKTSAMERQITEATLKKEISQKLTYALAIAEFLVDSGADVNQETPYGTPLMSAATSDWNTDIIDYLLKSGADIDRKDHNGRTALFYAAVNDSKEVTIQLLSAGADINIKDNDGKTYMEVLPEEWIKE